MCYFHDYAVEYGQSDVILPIWGVRFLIRIVPLWSYLSELVLYAITLFDWTVITESDLIKYVHNYCLEYHQEKEACMEINRVVIF